MPSEAAPLDRSAAAVVSRGSDSAEVIEVMGLRLHDLDGKTIAERSVFAVRSGQKLLVVNANAHMVVLAQTRPWLRELFQRANIAFCDGAGVQLAIRLLNGRVVRRTTPPEWIGNFLSALGEDASIFWVGGTPEVVAAAAARYEEQYGVRTAGVQHGYFDLSPDSAESRELVARINAAQPSILMVTMGMPRQEQWLWDHWDRLVPCVALTGGALVDHAAGRVSRPPLWVANLGLEWFVRLIREPRRLWRRYLLGLPVFAGYILRYAVIGRNK